MTPFIWALLTSFTWGFVPIVEKMGLLKIDPMVGLFYRCFGVVTGLVLLWAFRSAEIKASFLNLHPGMLFLILGGFLASVIGQIFFYHALKGGESSMVVPLAASYPLVTFVLGVLFLGEKITFAKLGGLGFILMGVFLLK